MNDLLQQIVDWQRDIIAGRIQDQRDWYLFWFVAWCILMSRQRCPNCGEWSESLFCCDQCRDDFDISDTFEMAQREQEFVDFVKRWNEEKRKEKHEGK